MSDIEYRLQVTIPGFRQPVVCGIQTGQETDQRTALPPMSVNVDSPPGQVVGPATPAAGRDRIAAGTY